MVPQQTQVVDDLDALLQSLPPMVIEPLKQIEDREGLLEIVLDLGRNPTARFPGREVILSTHEVTDEDIDHVVSSIGEFGDDNRAGITRTLHRISAIRNRKGRIIGLTCRIGRAVFGTIGIIRDIVEAGHSILLLGRPGVGKTTMLREVARVLADEFDKRVIVVDTSNEIAGDGDIPHPGIGRARRMQVPTPSQQHAVMIEAVENHMPEVIVIDEIGTELEAMAARTIAERGVQLVGTAHGNTLENLMLNPTLSDLIGGIQSVTLGDEEARRRGTQKSILERKAPPTFDVVVEIKSWDRVAVHPDVAATVDAILRGQARPAQTRAVDEAGQVTADEPAVRQAPAPRDRSVLRAMPPIETGLAPPTSATRHDGANRLVAPAVRSIRIYPFGVSHNRLEQAIEEMRLPVEITKDANRADVVMTLKNYYRKRPPAIRDAEASGVPVYVLKSNTVLQMEQSLASMYDMDVESDPVSSAMQEAQEAISQVLSRAESVELTPQNAYIRRLQHQLVERYNLSSRSEGREPHRRVKIFP
jgi:stage III sporulation protein SpoIIIAA